MEWLRQSYKQSQIVEKGDNLFAREKLGGKKLVRHAPGKKHPFRLQLIFALMILALPEAYAVKPEGARETVKGASAYQSLGGWHVLNEEELRTVSAKGLPEDRLFQRLSMYVTSGFSVEVLGDMATALNPVRSLLDADTTFTDAVFNPSNPTVIIDKNGSFMVRIPDTIGTISFDNIRVRGSNGKSFGSVTINNIDVRGTTIRVTTRR